MRDPQEDILSTPKSKKELMAQFNRLQQGISGLDRGLRAIGEKAGNKMDRLPVVASNIELRAQIDHLNAQIES